MSRVYGGSLVFKHNKLLFDQLKDILVFAKILLYLFDFNYLKLLFDFLTYLYFI